MAADSEDPDDAIDVPEPADAEAIASLFREDMTHLGVETDHEELVGLAERIVDGMQSDPPQCLCWVARTDEDGSPGGVIVANFNWSLKFAGRALWIEELYVTPDARRGGFGRALVRRVESYAERHDVSGIDVEAYQGNTPASVLYRTAGYRRLGRERFYKPIDD